MFDAHLHDLLPGIFFLLYCFSPPSGVDLSCCWLLFGCGIHLFSREYCFATLQLQQRPLYILCRLPSIAPVKSLGTNEKTISGSMRSRSADCRYSTGISLYSAQIGTIEGPLPYFKLHPFGRPFSPMRAANPANDDVLRRHNVIPIFCLRVLLVVLRCPSPMP